MAGVLKKIQDQHHNLTTAVLSREEKNVSKLTTTIRCYTEPFTEPGDDLFNLVTKVVMSEEVKRDLCVQSIERAKLLNMFFTERIQKGNESLWSPMKKRKLLTWKSTGKKTKVTANNKIVELREDRCLFACVLMMCQSRPEINLQEAIGMYEFSLVTRSLFAADGTILPCSTKSALMSFIEKEAPAAATSSDETTGVHVARSEVVIVDGMVELQSLYKPAAITTCAHLAEHFTEHPLQKHCCSEEIRLVFDRYDVPRSLKSGTRAW